jgi:hypothetical protein
MPQAALDMSAAIIAVVTNTTAPVRALTKYRPEQVLELSRDSESQP